jgi:hypothetical protein
MTRIGRLVTWPVRVALNLRYGRDRATCPYCLDRLPVARLTLHCETNHAGDRQD